MLLFIGSCQRPRYIRQFQNNCRINLLDFSVEIAVLMAQPRSKSHALFFSFVLRLLPRLKDCLKECFFKIIQEGFKNFLKAGKNQKGEGNKEKENKEVAGSGSATLESLEE